MASRSSQKRKTLARKARQGKAWELYKQANAQKRGPNLSDLQFRTLRQPVKHAVVMLLKAVESSPKEKPQ